MECVTILGAFHGIEVLSVFGWPQMTLGENEEAYNHSQAHPVQVFNFTEGDMLMAEFVMTLWTNFAKFR